MTDEIQEGAKHAYPHLHVEPGFFRMAGGLTKRERFAVEFMAAMMTGKSVYQFDHEDAEIAAATAAMAADALIAELAK